MGQIRLALGHRILLGSQLLERCGGVRDLRLGGTQRGLERVRVLLRLRSVSGRGPSG